jgi:CRISPR/Cas system endoribonuclease Cas6 (RAMP superfamily)
MDKHFAFLLDCPTKGEYMMFPDYYENLKEGIDRKYEACDEKVIQDNNWKADLSNIKYKVFKIKNIE